MSFTLANRAESVRHYENNLAYVSRRLSIPRTVARWAVKSNPDVLFNNTEINFDLPKHRDSNNKTCHVCMEAVDLKRSNVSFLPCDHRIHIACAKAMIASYVEQNKPLECWCHKGVMMTDKRFAGIVQKNDLPSCYVKCPSDTCERWIYANSENGQCVPVTCLCGHSFCHSCKGSVHGNTTCLQVRQLVDGVENIRRVNEVSVDDVTKWLVYRYPFAFGINLPTISSIVECVPNDIATTFNLVDEKVVGFGSVDAEAVLERYRAIVNDDDILVITTPNPFANLLDDDYSESENSRSKFCPKCFVTIGRVGGCPSMTCPMCRYSFCYNCLGPQHTHDECTNPVDVAALTARTGSEPEKLKKLIAGLSRFSPEGELADTDRDARAYHLRMTGMSDKSHMSRMIRLIPLAMRKARLEALMAANASSENVANEAGQLACQIDLFIKHQQPFIDRATKEYTHRLNEMVDNSSHAKTIADKVIAAAKTRCIDSLLRQLDRGQAQRSTLLDIIGRRTKAEIISLTRNAIEKLSIEDMIFHELPFKVGDAVKIFNGYIVPGQVYKKFTEHLVGVHTAYNVIAPVVAVYHDVMYGVISDGHIDELARIIDLLRAALEKDFQLEEPRMFERFFNGSTTTLTPVPICIGDMVKWGQDSDLLVTSAHGTEFELFVAGEQFVAAPKDELTHMYPRHLPFLSAKGNRALHALGVVIGFIKDDSPLYQAKKEIVKSCHRTTEIVEWTCPSCTYLNYSDRDCCECCEIGVREMSGESIKVDTEVCYKACQKFIDELRQVL